MQLELLVNFCNVLEMCLLRMLSCHVHFLRNLLSPVLVFLSKSLLCRLKVCGAHQMSLLPHFQFFTSLISKAHLRSIGLGLSLLHVPDVCFLGTFFAIL